MLSTLFLSLFALIMGLAFCFAGYRLFLVMLPIWGFFAGFWLGAEATTLLFGAGFLATTTSWVVGFIVGLFGAILSYLFYMLGVALVSAGFGWALGAGFMGALGFDSGILTFIVSLVVAVIMMFLVLGLNLQKLVIIVITAIGGANAILLSGLLLFGRVTTDSLSGAGNAIAPIMRDSWFWLVVWLIIAGFGIFGQLKTNRSYTFSKEQHIEVWG